MDIDSTSQSASIIRSKSDEKFIRDLDLGKPEDSHAYLIHLLEKYMSHNSITIPNNAKFKEHTCLEHRLDRRVTQYIPNSEDNVKLVLAVSGAGKTRMLLELLYLTPGYYFTVKSSVPDFGSADLGNCRVHCEHYPEEAERAIRLLYFIRVSVCNYLISKELKDPKTILLAQLHPTAFFGCDIFSKLFTKLMNEATFNAMQIKNSFAFVAIDEIQVTFEGTKRHLLPNSGTKRPFFSPLVHYSKLMNVFPTFLLSGTGINFQFVKEAMESGAMKRNLVTAYEVVADFHPLSKSQVESFAAQFLEDQKVDGADEIVSRISAFELCHGRPRFVAYILDGYMESKDIDFSISEFIYGISNVDGGNFPLRFFKSDLKDGNSPLNRVISGSTLGDIIRKGLLSLLLKGTFLISIDDDKVGQAAIRYGLGFGETNDEMLYTVEINELAVMESLRVFIPFSDIVMEFAKQISAYPKPRMVGYLLEYLVAFALVANFSEDDVSRINVSQRVCDDYLNRDDNSQVCFPDHMCGPDIIYKCVKTKTVYIVQVKFVKRMTKQEIVNAYDTTDSTKFYCKRKLKEGESGDIVLEKFRDKRTKLLAALLNVQTQGYSVQQLLFTHTGGSNRNYVGDARIINSNNSPRFFDKLGTADVWAFLDSVRGNFDTHYS
ncbi:hypothetical protein BC833DRAFT_533201 [Globomyces pollinis-pini]|nr:hypothetical protein BC833DRAFT_533201 [Globomyces pollinis-pini]